MRTNEIFTLESRELNEGKKVAFIAGGINRDINKVNLNDKMKSIGEHTQYFPLVVVDGEDVVKEGLTLKDPVSGLPVDNEKAEVPGHSIGSGLLPPVYLYNSLLHEARYNEYPGFPT